MKTIQMNVADFVQQYNNHGQNMEALFRFTLTGEYSKADNVKHSEGTDLGVYQIKSARATVCNGLDIEKYLDDDKALVFAYVAKNGIAYIMTKQEYIAFVNAFGTVTKDSQKNGGRVKIRLKHENATMIQYLNERA